MRALLAALLVLAACEAQPLEADDVAAIEQEIFPSPQLSQLCTQWCTDKHPAGGTRMACVSQCCAYYGTNANPPMEDVCILNGVPVPIPPITHVPGNGGNSTEPPSEFVPFAGETTPEQRLHCHNVCFQSFNAGRETCHLQYRKACSDEWRRHINDPDYIFDCPTEPLYWNCINYTWEMWWECDDWCDGYPF